MYILQIVRFIYGRQIISGGDTYRYLEDMTYRAVRVLEEVDVIAAEDTRNSIKLLNHFEIKTPMTSYHEYNKYDKAKVLVEKMQQGQNVAVITDAGTPGISDPGEELVRQALDAGLEVTPVPGAVHVYRHLSARDFRPEDLHLRHSFHMTRRTGRGFLRR